MGYLVEPDSKVTGLLPVSFFASRVTERRLVGLRKIEYGNPAYQATRMCSATILFRSSYTSGKLLFEASICACTSLSGPTLLWEEGKIRQSG